MTYYHGTDEEGATAILRDGLKCPRDLGDEMPSEEEFEDYDEPYLWDGVFVTDSVERASMFGDVILTVDIAGLEVFDEAYFDKAKDGSPMTDLTIVGSIGSERIGRA